MFPCQALFSKMYAILLIRIHSTLEVKMTSIIDVAKLPVSRKSTVSRLISGKGYVSADSQEKFSKQ